MTLQLLLIGLAMGMIYSLMAMGLILIVKAVGVLNFAHGELFMVGAYVCFLLTVQVNLPLIVTIFCALVIFFLFGALFMFSVYWPLRGAEWPICVVISTLGASIALKEAVRLIWGPFPMRVRPLIAGFSKLGPARLQNQYLLIILVSSVLIAFVFILFEKMRIGRMMQAAAQNRYAAELLGIPTIVTIMATYMISTTLSGIGGWLSSPIFMVSQTLGVFALYAFAGIVIGGFGSIKGAVVGSVLVGIIQSYSILVTTNYNDVIVFMALILMLMIRPQGIFGEKIDEKA